MPCHAMPSSSPTDPDSPYSQTARLACWLTGGGTRRSPSTAISLLKMARERNAVKNAEVEWTKRKKAVLAVHVEQWGKSALLGLIEEVAAVGPRPRGTALLRWSREQQHGDVGGRRGEEEQEEGRQRLGEGGESVMGRSIGKSSTTAEPPGQQAVDDGSDRAEDIIDSASVNGQDHDDTHMVNALAAHEDEVDAGSDQGTGTSTSGARRGDHSS